MQKGNAKTFEEKTLHVISESLNDKGGGTVLKVLSWVVDGKVMKPVIEKREFWMTEEGTRRVGKAKGLTGLDVLAILRGLSTIAPHLQIPAADVQLVLAEMKGTRTVASVPSGSEVF